MILYCQKNAIAALRADATVQNLLGGTLQAPRGVMEDMGFMVDDVVYPMVTVGVNTSTTMPHQQVRQEQSKYFQNVYLDVNILSNDSSVEQARLLETAVVQCIESSGYGDGSDVTISTIESYGLISSMKDTETGIWHSVIRFIFTGKLN